MSIAQNFVREMNSIENPDFQDVTLISLKFDNKRVIRELLEDGKDLDQEMIRFSDQSRCFVVYSSTSGKYVDKTFVTKKKWEEVFPDGEDSWEYTENEEANSGRVRIL